MAPTGAVLSGVNLFKLNGFGRQRPHLVARLQYTKVVSRADDRYTGRQVRMRTLDDRGHPRAAGRGSPTRPPVFVVRRSVQAILGDPLASRFPSRLSFVVVALLSLTLTVGTHAAIGADPVALGSVDTPGDAVGVAVVGSVASVADFESGLRLIDVSRPSAPEEIGSILTADAALAVSVLGGLAYVAGGYSGLQIISVSEPGMLLSALAALTTLGVLVRSRVRAERSRPTRTAIGISAPGSRALRL